MKLLYILSEYLPDSGGGIISHYARILPGLVEQGHDVTVLLASKGKLDQPDYGIDGVRVRPLKAKFLEQYANRFERWAGLEIFYYLLPVAWAAWAQAQEEWDYDLVEATDWALLFLPWMAAEKRVPVVVSMHGSCGQVDWFGKGEPRSLDGDLVRMVEAAALRGADVVHANSRANAEFWQEKTGREIRVIPPAYGGRDVADGGERSFEPHPGGWAAARETAARLPEGRDERERTSQISRMGTDGQQGDSQGTCAGAAFSNPFTIELAQDCENTSPTRSASGPAGVEEPPKADGGGRIASEDRRSKIGDRGIGSDGGNQLADSAGFLKGQSQSGLQMDNQKDLTIRTANDLRACVEKSESVVIREIRGSNSNALNPRPSTLDAPGLVVGRLQNLKGAEVLCQAMRLAPEIEIEWAGGDTDWGSTGLKASEYLAANYPDVFVTRLRWLGRLDREEVDKKIESAAFLVAPSFLDVFNLTVAEGMEAGLPVICSRAAGAEMLIEHGKSGLLFDPAKPDELAACLNRIVEMSAVDRNEMGRKAQEAVKALLSEERILNLLEGSYKETIEKGTPQRIDEWLESLLSPGAGLKAPSQVGFARRVLRKFGRMLTQI
jgi:glycosyltransferase involved in cell wall biosynthesis